MTLVDPLPEDHLLEGLVWEEQANHLHWEGKGRDGREVLGSGGVGWGEIEVVVQIVRMGQEGKKKMNRWKDWMSREDGIIHCML